MSEWFYIGVLHKIWKHTCKKLVEEEEITSEHMHVCVMTRKVLPYATTTCVNTVQVQLVEGTSSCCILLKVTAHPSDGHVNAVISVNSPVHVLIVAVE